MCSSDLLLHLHKEKEYLWWMYIPEVVRNGSERGGMDARIGGEAMQDGAERNSRAVRSSRILVCTLAAKVVAARAPQYRTAPVFSTSSAGSSRYLPH